MGLKKRFSNGAELTIMVGSLRTWRVGGWEIRFTWWERGAPNEPWQIRHGSDWARLDWGRLFIYAKKGDW